ncbi:MAG: DUF58 domain-containing protein [Candidatus Thermoplasmatota archaeon]
MLTSTGRTILGAGLAFALGGLVFGNWPFFGAGALLLILSAFSALSASPRARIGADKSRIERGGCFTFVMDVDLPRGFGVIELHQALPEEFELVNGNNLHVLTLGLKPRSERFTFRVRAPKRGEYVLPALRVKMLHPLGFATTPSLPQGEPLRLIVEPRPVAARIPRDLRTRAKRPFPEGDIARLGVATNEFRELREYVPGDPPRRINWKATARRMGAGGSEVPLVNETEWEGKKSVWIIVDGHPRLSVGTNLEDVREHAADAALSLMEIYLRRGYQVGIALARSGQVAPLRPGTGEAQVRRAREVLSRLRAADGPSLIETMDRDGAILHRGKPLIVLVTRLSGNDKDLEAAVRRMGVLARLHSRTVTPGLVVDVTPAPPHGDDIALAARTVADAGTMGLRAAAKGAGVRVTTWRAGQEPLETVLVRGRIA